MKLKGSANIEVFEESFKKHKDSALMTLIGFYKGYYHNFVLSMIFYIIKHSPVWVLPIVTANIINSVTSGEGDPKRLIITNAIVLAVLLIMTVVFGSSSESSAFGLTRNPFDTDRVPGGSSGGSAAAIRQFSGRREAPGRSAVATDTIRQELPVFFM